MKLSLGFSPCPNDTFIFDALVNGKMDTRGLQLDVHIADVQELNEWAQQGRLDVSKISYGALPGLLKDYKVLRSGGALGKGVGPLLITRLAAGEEDTHVFPEEMPVAIPGAHTTAHFLFSHAFPQASQKVFMRFDEIENWVLAGIGAGVIIHENRFTYAQRGLHCKADLGTLWEASTGYPIPLGGIVGKKSLPPGVLHLLDTLITESLDYAWRHYPALPDYVKELAQEMDESVMRAHIGLYVNEFSRDMGPEGSAAILKMLEIMQPEQAFGTEIFA